MSERTSALHAVLVMEDDVYSVLRYAQALAHIASSQHMVEPECLTALSDPLCKIGERLREQFTEAFKAAGRQS